MNKSIPELVDSFVRGDASAFTELVRRYQKNIYYLAYRLLGNHLDADDVVQETFVRVFRHQKEIGSVSSFTSFLTRIATNYAIDLLRKRRGRASVGDDLTLLPGQVQIELARRVRTPDELLNDKVIMEEIQRALDRLPPRQRITMLLHDLEGYTKAEVAAILECPEATVRSNLHIARGKLKKVLRKRLSAQEKK